MKKQFFWIRGYKNKYSISQNGDIYSHSNRWGILNCPIKRKHVLGKNGYYVISLYNKNCENRMYVHRLLAETFLIKPAGRNFVNHKDGNKKNNALTNLEWCTQKENNLHGFQIGLNKPLNGTKPGENCPSSKLTNIKVLEIRKRFTGKNAISLAAKYKITSANIRMIIKRKTWKHI